MVKLILDGQSIEVEEGWTILEAANYYGVEIHHHEVLSSNLYKADSITDLLYTLAIVPGIDNATDIDITTKPEDW